MERYTSLSGRFFLFTERSGCAELEVEDWRIAEASPVIGQDGTILRWGQQSSLGDSLMEKKWGNLWVSNDRRGAALAARQHRCFSHERNLIVLGLRTSFNGA
jgi:hypothetical protein